MENGEGRYGGEHRGREEKGNGKREEEVMQRGHRGRRRRRNVYREEDREDTTKRWKWRREEER